MPQTLEVVKRHFDNEAERFDAIYEANKPLYQRAMDRFRRVVVERFHLVRNLVPVQGPWSVCDVGCGSGRYTIALAQDGANRAVGVDVSQNMIELARTEAGRLKVGPKCEFVQSGFLNFTTSEKFDVVVAMGYFDYLDQPLPHLVQMKAICQGKVMASFPKRWEIRVPIRKLRFLLVGGYVRLYSLREVRALFRDAGVAPDHVSLIDLGRDWIAVARVQ